MRYNTFNQIHKALRALLYDTALTLQQTNFNDAEESHIAIEKVRLTAEMFDSHASHEDQYVLPAIAAYEPSVVAAFEAEHETDLKLADQLRDSIYAVELAKKAKTEMGIELTKAFVTFMVFNLNHMAKEEDVINKILWRYYTDTEIMAINQKIVASLPPSHLQTSAIWIMRGMNNQEIVSWMKAVEKTAPESVFQQLFATAESELPTLRFREILEALTNVVMA